MFAQPHQEHGASGQTHDGCHAETKTRGNNQASRGFEGHGNTQRLEQSQTQCAKACVLGNFATTCFALFLELLKGRQDVGEQLHDDGGRDVRHDAQREHGEARQSTTREHVEQTENAALLTIEELLQLCGVNAWNGNVGAHTVNHQREQQEGESATQVSVLAFVGCCCASDHCLSLCSIRPRSHQQLQWLL